VASDKKTFEAVTSGGGTVNFRDFERLLVGLGFRLDRVSGSHHIYIHPTMGRPFPIQPDGKDAKRYQIRQLRRIIRLYRLTLGSNE
jgi:predicted RNA binding protein YcfA (HicA-like mRNA interferase family)